MKKIITVLLNIVFLAVFAPTTLAYDFSYTYQGQTLYYNINNGNAVVTHQNSISPRYTNLNGALSIPSTVAYNGTSYSVTAIYGYAFSGCTGLTSITIPNTVTTIYEDAFSGCTGITSITIPNSVTGIYDRAFYGCTGLTALTIPESVTRINEQAFYNCSALITVDFNATNCTYMGIGAVGAEVFSGCSSLTTLNIGNNVHTIPDYAFATCSSLTSVHISNSVTSIGGAAFSGCTGLTSITIPNSVTSIGDGAFSGCTGLTSITIPNSVTSIGEAFYNCSGLTTVDFNATNCTSTAAAGVFFGCTSLRTINIGNNVQTIPDKVFACVTGLTSVSIPNSVTSIGNGAFSSCTGLTSVIIPNSVTSIGGRAFSYCSGLTSITIGNSVISIGSSAFYNCSSLTEIYSLNNVAPTLGSDAFSSVTSTIPVHIPCGALASYYSRWSYFSNFIEDEAFIFSAVSADPTKGAVQILTMPTCTNPQAVVYASPNSGYQFDHWSDNSTANPYSLTVNEDMELIAYFRANNGIDDIDIEQVKVFARGNEIVVSGAGDNEVIVYDVLGRVLHRGTAYAPIRVPSQGLYMVKVGEGKPQKVIVNY